MPLTFFNFNKQKWRLHCKHISTQSLRGCKCCLQLPLECKFLYVLVLWGSASGLQKWHFPSCYGSGINRLLYITLHSKPIGILRHHECKFTSRSDEVVYYSRQHVHSLCFTKDPPVEIMDSHQRTHPPGNDQSQRETKLTTSMWFHLC